MNRVIILAALWLLLAAAPLALAQDPAAVANAQMQETIERLQLTPEQQSALEPILRASMDARRDIMASYGINPGSGEKPDLKRKQLRAMKKEMDAITKDTRAQIEPLLTAEQFDEFERITEERRKAMRDRIRNR